jgi:hypothetical protein
MDWYILPMWSRLSWTLQNATAAGCALSFALMQFLKCRTNAQLLLIRIFAWNAGPVRKTALKMPFLCGPVWDVQPASSMASLGVPNPAAIAQAPAADAVSQEI